MTTSTRIISNFLSLVSSRKVWMMILVILGLSMVGASDNVTVSFVSDMRPSQGFSTLTDDFNQTITLSPSGYTNATIIVGDFDGTTQLNKNLTNSTLNLSQVFYVLGNHENSITDLNYVRNAFPNYSYSPLQGPNRTENTTYSFDVGDIHIIVLNLYWDGTNNSYCSYTVPSGGTNTSEMCFRYSTSDGGYIPDGLYNWVQNDLENTTKPWKIVVGHENLYPLSSTHNGDSLDANISNRDSFVSLLDSYNVSAYVTGHEHFAYMRKVGNLWILNAGVFGDFSGGSNDNGDTIIYAVANSTNLSFSLRKNYLNNWSALTSIDFDINGTDYIPITDCGTWLNMTSMNYKLINDITSTGSCIYNGAYGWNLTGDYYTISYGSSGSGIGISDITHLDKHIIENIYINRDGGTFGIYFGNTNNLTFRNISLSNGTSNYFFYVELNADNMVIDNVTSSVTSGRAAFIKDSNNFTITNSSLISATGASLVLGITATKGQDINIYNNNIYSTSTGLSYYITGAATVSTKNITFLENNFTSTRKWSVDNNLSHFNMSNSSGIWLDSSLNNITTATLVTSRTLSNWSLDNVTFSEQPTVTGKKLQFNFSGLRPNYNYRVWNGTSNDYNLTTDASGILTSFNINFTTSSKTIKVLSNGAISSSSSPNITSYYNNQSSWNNSIVYSLHNSSVFFNVTANQSGNYNWTKDGVNQNNDFDNITLNWTDSGSYYVTANITNVNGTSSDIIWNVTVEYGNITVSDTQSWQNQNRIHAGYIFVKGNNANLTIDNTDIYFNETIPQKSIIVGSHTSAKLTIQNNSLVSVTDTNTMWTGICVSTGAHFNLSDSTLERFNGSALTNPPDNDCSSIRGGLTLYEIGLYIPSVTNIDNLTMKDWGAKLTGEISGAITSQNTYHPVNLKNSNLSGNITLVPQTDTVNFIYYINIMGDIAGTVENNTFTDQDRGIQITIGNNFTVKNNTFTNLTNFVSFFNYVNDSYLGYNTFIKSTDIDDYTTAGCNTNCWNNTYEHNTVFGVLTQSTPGLHFNKKAINITFQYNNFYNTTFPILGGHYIDAYNNNITIHDVYANGTPGYTKYARGYELNTNNSIIYNVTFEDYSNAGDYCVLTRDTTYSGYLYNITFTNITLNRCYRAITVNDVKNITFIDTNISNSILYDIEFLEPSQDVKFINTKINFSKLNLTSEQFNNYYYASINVTNLTGSPILGATVSFTNTINPSYPSINRAGTTTTSYTTDASGHTPLPIGNDSTTPVLMNMIKNSTSQENMTYTVNVNDSSFIYPNINTSINSTGHNSPQQPVASTTISPNSSWYRPNPNTYQNTTTIQLPASTNWSILPDTTISVNASSDKNLSATWSGSATVLFNTTIPEWASQVLYLQHNGIDVDNKTANITGFVNFSYTGSNGDFNVSNVTGDISLNVYNIGWQYILVNSTITINEFNDIYDTNWISHFNVDTQEYEEIYKSGWPIYSAFTISGGEGIAVKFTTNKTITMSRDDSYNWVLSEGWNLQGIELTKTLSEINTSINTACEMDQILFTNLSTEVESIYTCGSSDNGTIEVKAGEAVFIHKSTVGIINTTRVW